jgi:hypothetical protein
LVPGLKEIRFEVQLSELWSVDSRLLTIIRSNSNDFLATGNIADNHII